MVKIRQRYIAGRPVSGEEARKTPINSGRTARLVAEVRRRVGDKP